MGWEREGRSEEGGRWERPGRGEKEYTGRALAALRLELINVIYCSPSHSQASHVVHLMYVHMYVRTWYKACILWFKLVLVCKSLHFILYNVIEQISLKKVLISTCMVDR